MNSLKSDLTEFKFEPGEFKSDLSVCCSNLSEFKFELGEFKSDLNF